MSNFKLIFLICILINPLSLASADLDNGNIIKIGALFSLSGYANLAGISELNGLMLAKEEINKKGGILDKRIELVVQDFNSDFKELTSSLIKLSSFNKVSYIIGPNWAEFVEVAAPVIARSQIQMITPSGFTHSIFKAGENIFSMQYAPEDVIRPFSDYIISRNFESLTFIISSNSFYEMLADSLEQSLEGKVSINRELITNDTLDYRSLLLKIRKKSKSLNSKTDGHGIVVFMGENGPASTFVKQAKSIGVKGENLLLGPIVPYDEVLKNDSQLNEDIIYFDYVSDLSESFKASYMKRFKEEPKLGAAFSYDALYLLKNSLERCNLNKKLSFKDCMLSGMENGASGDVRFSDDRKRVLLSQAAAVFQIKNGKEKRLK